MAHRGIKLLIHHGGTWFNPRDGIRQPARTLTKSGSLEEHHRQPLELSSGAPALFAALAFPTFAQHHGGGHHSSSTRSRSSSHTSKSHKSKFHRSAAAKDQFMGESGYPHGRKGYLVEHKIPLACGGADSPSNMQWQTKADAKAKDKWERNGCR
jgi:hypothetical protein